jgi:LuxR family transcriptional regulator, maltose regulon positive regulatory protein
VASPTKIPPIRTLVVNGLRPKLPADLVWRTRLIDVLDAAVRKSVTLICAGAGWGKTTLVASWSAARSLSSPIAWLTVGVEHAEPARFWTDLMAAVTAAGVALPRDPPLPGEPRFHPWLAQAMATLPVTLVLVLDDVHKLTDKRVLGALDELIRRAPGRLRFVLAGRQEPDLSLHRYRASGELTELRAADLGFEVPEAAEWVAVHGRAMPMETIAQLVRAVEGWPAGLRLMLDPVRGSAAEHTVEDYLLQEVLTGLPTELQQFLLHTSVADRVSGALAEALTGRPNGQRTLEWLARDNLFVEPVGTRGWFRYHVMFRSALRRRLRTAQPEVVTGLHLSAARWYAASDNPLPALKHAAAAGEWPLAAHLVMRHGMLLYASVDRVELLDVLGQIPADRLSGSTDLVLCAAVLAFDRGDIAATSARLAEARALRRPGPGEATTPTDIALALLESAVLIRWRGDMPSLMDRATVMLRDVVAAGPMRGPEMPRYRAVALKNKAVALLWSDQLDQADRYLWAASTEARSTSLPQVAVAALGNLALLDYFRGSLRRADSNVAAAVDISRRTDSRRRPSAVPAHLARAFVESEQGRDIEADEALREALHAGGEVPEAVNVVLAAIVRARLLADRGDGLAARGVLRQAWREAGPQLVAPLLVRLTGLVESDIDVVLGDPAAVLNRYRNARSLAPGEHVCLARAHLTAGRLDAAESELDRIRPASDRVAAVSAWVLTALVADLRGRHASAAEALRRAVAVAEPDRIRRPFRLCDPQRLHALAGRQHWLTDVRGQPSDAALAEITGEVPLVVPSAGPLSEREMEVLQYLPTMLTAAEIGENLSISINTVKAHIRAIYRKLGAVRRREAVATARHLGLL